MHLLNRGGGKTHESNNCINKYRIAIVTITSAEACGSILVGLRDEGWEELTRRKAGAGMFQAEGVSCAKALRQEKVWGGQRTHKNTREFCI